MKHILNTEPAVLFALVRSIAYIAVGATGAWLSPGMVEPILGVLAALLGVDAATTAATRANVSSGATTDGHLDAVYSGAVGRFVRQTVVNLVPDKNVARALLVAVPIVTDFAESKLNDGARDQIQKQVLLKLRAAGLMNTRSTRPASLFIALVVVGLAGCAPITAGVIDLVGGDDATLRAVPGGIEFGPGGESALGVVLMMTFEEADNLDARCETEAEGDLTIATCRLGEVTEPDVVSIESDAVSALARYQREDSGRTFGVALE